MRVILTGATGMIGEGVLLECLQNSEVSEVLSISRKTNAYVHPKMKEYLVEDFLSLRSTDEALKGYDACFFCAGKSSAGMNEADYTKITYDITIHFAEVLKQINPDITFNFVSGAFTDNTEKGKVMWARVKGKTENALTKIFKNSKAFYFRPALMKPTEGQRHLYGYNRIAHKILFPVMRIFYPSCTIREIGKAMIYTATKNSSKKVLEVKDIKAAAKLST